MPEACVVYSLIALALVLSTTALAVSLPRRRSRPPPPVLPTMPTMPTRSDASHDMAPPSWGATPAGPSVFAPAERYHSPEALTRPDHMRFTPQSHRPAPDTARTLSQQRDDLAAAIEADARRLRASADLDQPSDHERKSQ